MVRTPEGLYAALRYPNPANSDLSFLMDMVVLTYVSDILPLEDHQKVRALKWRTEQALLEAST